MTTTTIRATACSLFSALLFTTLMACGGESALEGRFVAVHNTMAAMGLAQTGSISEGSLAEGDDMALEEELTAGECYTFVALGDDGVDDIDVLVLDEGGEEIARDGTRDRQAATQVCPERGGAHRIVIRMTEGDGGFAVSSWSGGRSGGSASARAAGGGGGGDCEAPLELTIGRPVRGSTTDATHRMTGLCAEGSAPEQVYRVEITERSQLSAVLQSTFDGAIYLLSTCGDPRSMLGCNDDAPDTTRSAIEVTVEPGEYYLVVDGYGEERGDYDLVVQLAELRETSAICNEATALAVGQSVSGSTTGAPDYFQATCADGARSGDRVYTLDVPSRSRLRLRQQSDHDGALHLRRSCTEPTTEIACNDDFRDEQHSLITTVVDPGRYYVVADGFGSGASGNYTLTADLTADGGGSASGEACDAPATLSAGQEMTVDTFEARDDYAGSCGGRGAPDVVYELAASARSRIRVDVNRSEFGGAVYLQSTCGDAGTEIVCAAIDDNGVASLDATVRRGTYYLVFDGARDDAFGSAKATVRVSDLAALNAMCRRAPRLRPGTPVSGSTATESDDFQATCAGGAQSNDAVYRLTLPRRQIVRATVQADYDSALYIRRDCADAATEIACNDDHENNNRQSFFETTLDAGTYFVVVDGFATGNAGTFTLEVETSNP